MLSGVASAVRPRSLLDRGATFTALVFYSMPTFVLGLLMIEVFYYQLTVHGLRWFPGSGYTSPTQSIFEWFRGLILPWLTLALVSAAAYTRLTRTAMLDVLGEDYIRTARAKGLSETRITFRHALRAALTPVVTQFGIDVGSLLGGAVITENVYGLPGLGYTAVQAISNQDLPVIIGVVIVASAAVVMCQHRRRRRLRRPRPARQAPLTVADREESFPRTGNRHDELTVTGLDARFRTACRNSSRPARAAALDQRSRPESDDGMSQAPQGIPQWPVVAARRVKCRLCANASVWCRTERRRRPLLGPDRPGAGAVERARAERAAGPGS